MGKPSLLEAPVSTQGHELVDGLAGIRIQAFGLLWYDSKGMRDCSLFSRSFNLILESWDSKCGTRVLPHLPVYPKQTLVTDLCILPPGTLDLRINPGHQEPLTVD